MAVGLQLITILFVSTGLWIGADACKDLVEGGGQESCKACPSGWTQFGSTCYMFQHNEKDWADAEKHCTTQGANLVSLHSKEQHTFIQDTLRTVAGRLVPIWIGGNDAAKEGVWLWSDGSLFDFNSWTKGEPNDYGGKEDCMELNFKGRENSNDNSCFRKKSYFCAKAL